MLLDIGHIVVGAFLLLLFAVEHGLHSSYFEAGLMT
jgi:hypothetical protein